MYQEKQDKGIQVISAGLGRTGTMSLTEALNILGYRTYHYLDFNHHQQWADFVEGKTSSDDIIDLIVNDGYTATSENPTCDMYQDLLDKYPEAKVVLTVRDSPEQFCKSWKTLFDAMVITEQKFSLRFPSFFGYIPLFSNLKKIRYFMGTTHLKLKPGELTHGWRENGDEWLAEQYNRHNNHVKANSKHVLVFNVKEGWEPLCKFLGKPIPQQPFPHVQVNTTKSLKELSNKLKLVVYWWIPTTSALMLGTAAFLYYLTGRKDTKSSLDGGIRIPPSLLFPGGKNSSTKTLLIN